MGAAVAAVEYVAVGAVATTASLTLPAADVGQRRFIFIGAFDSDAELAPTYTLAGWTSVAYIGPTLSAFPWGVGALTRVKVGGDPDAVTVTIGNASFPANVRACGVTVANGVSIDPTVSQKSQAGSSITFDNLTPLNDGSLILACCYNRAGQNHTWVNGIGTEIADSNGLSVAYLAADAELTTTQKPMAGVNNIDTAGVAFVVAPA